jgi:hypothetical protein
MFDTNLVQNMEGVDTLKKHVDRRNHLTHRASIVG